MNDHDRGKGQVMFDEKLARGLLPEGLLVSTEFAPQESLKNAFTSEITLRIANGRRDAGRRFLSNLAAILLALWGASAVSAATPTILHSFADGLNDGAVPLGDVTVNGLTLYGVTSGGGSSTGSDPGTIFKMNTDGTGFSLLHTFAVLGDGWMPEGNLSFDGSCLYGMTRYGGTANDGTIFKINSDGSGYSILHSFTGGSNDGSAQGGLSGLTLSGSTLYGMTYGGGNGDGVVFELNTNGTGFSLLHSFTGGSNDGAGCSGRLTLIGSTLYGMTCAGGIGEGGLGNGVIFKINTNGTGFSLLHTFTGESDDGGWPESSLTFDGSYLYGTTRSGGANGSGTIFKLDTDGSGFAILHSFAGGSTDGSFPQYDSLTLLGSTLYGMTSGGGANDDGTIFEINTNGTGYSLMHSFAGSSGDGADPFWNDLTASDSLMYGMTTRGGSGTNFGVTGFGTVFSIAVPEPSTLMLLLCAAVLGLLAYVWRRSRRGPEDIRIPSSFANQDRSRRTATAVVAVHVLGVEVGTNGLDPRT